MKVDTQIYEKEIDEILHKRERPALHDMSVGMSCELVMLMNASIIKGREIECNIKKNVSAWELHTWYLEATKKLHPESFNAKAQVPYEQLTEEQKFIDIFIAQKINEAIQ